MKLKESSLDIYAFVSLYTNEIIGSFIKKIHQISANEFVFQLYRSGEGRKSLFISMSKGVAFLDRETPDTPSPLSMMLRNMLTDRKVLAIEQINFDRVVRIDLSGGYVMVLEMFREGNLIITQDNEIQYAFNQREWKNRKIIRGYPYIPPTDYDPIQIHDEEFSKLVLSSKGSIVQTLATRMNLGGDIAEELIHRLSMDKNAPAHSFTEFSALRSGIAGIMKESLEGKAFLYEDELTVSPVRLTHLEKEPDRIFTSLSEGLEYYLSNYPETSDKLDPIERRILSIKKSIEEFGSIAQQKKEEGALIFSQLRKIETVIREIQNGERKIESGSRLPSGVMVKEIDAGRKTCTVEIDETIVFLRYNKKATENGNMAFQESKDYLAKIEGAQSVIKEMESRKPESIRKGKKKERRHFWFETYRWFISSEGNLVISGKDRKTNERVVKRHMDHSDVYVHADLYGAPSTIVKAIDTTRPGEITLREAGQFAVCCSRAWPALQASGSAYWVFPEQVSKTAETGEYVTSGSWVIRGKRNYFFNLPMQMFVGLASYSGDEIPMAAPVPECFSGKYVKIQPSKDKREGAARKIAEILQVEIEDIERILPPGGSSIS